MSLAQPIDRRIHPFVAPQEESAIRARLVGRAEPLAKGDDNDTETVLKWLGEALQDFQRGVIDRLDHGPGAVRGPSPIREAIPQARPAARNDTDQGPATRRHSLDWPPQAPEAYAPPQPRASAQRRDEEFYRPQPTRSRLPQQPLAPNARQPADDIPAFLRHPNETFEHPQLPALRRPTQPQVRRRAPQGSQSTASALVLAYLLFFLIPLTEWTAGFFDPRISAVAPFVFFIGWLTIHAMRGDQLFQLRMLTAWQVAHAAIALNAIGPWDRATTSLAWTAAALAGASALIVVAMSAIVETLGFRDAASFTSNRPTRQVPGRGPAD